MGSRIEVMDRVYWLWNEIKKRAELDQITEKIYAQKRQPLIHSVFVWTFCVISSYSLGKVLAITLKPKTIDKPLRSFQYELADSSLNQDSRNAQEIKERNLFNSRIHGGPEPQRKDSLQPCALADSPSHSNKVQLLNTTVLQNEKKSVAALKISFQNKVINLRQGEIIPKVGRLNVIASRKIVFRNDQSGQCEFAEIPKEGNYLTPSFSVLPPKEGAKHLASRIDQKDIIQENNNFKIKRSYLNEGLGNIGELLKQARATQINNSDGTISFKITNIAPESVFSKLGIENEDQIQFIDGSPIQSQAEIFSLISGLKKNKKLSLTVLRNGSKQELNYQFID